MVEFTSLEYPGSVLMFTINANPVGYIAMTAGGKWVRGRAKKYIAWKELVQNLAKARGIRLPLAASEGSEIEIETQAHFRNRTHPDPENVHKGIVDSLFYGGKGDKYTAGRFGWPQYDPEQPRVVVILRRRR